MKIVDSRLVFNQFTVHQYEDGTYRFEDYPPRFEGILDCLKWGRAFQEAEKKIAEAEKEIARLKEETKDNLKGTGVLWA